MCPIIIVYGHFSFAIYIHISAGNFGDDGAYIKLKLYLKVTSFDTRLTNFNILFKQSISIHWMYYVFAYVPFYVKQRGNFTNTSYLYKGEKSQYVFDKETVWTLYVCLSFSFSLSYINSLSFSLILNLPFSHPSVVRAKIDLTWHIS